MKLNIKTLSTLVLTLISFTTFAADKPNVELMLTDNVGYGDIGAFSGGEGAAYQN